jgi:parallel beta-helix repeat protein
MSTIYNVAPAPLGNDSNNGSSAAPFETIKKASSAAAAGDTIHITAGTYYETVTPQRDHVTYIGEPGSIIDPSIDPSTVLIDPNVLSPNAWRSELLNGITVWKIKLGFEPGIFTYNGKCIECVGQRLMSADLIGASLDWAEVFGLWPDFHPLPRHPPGLALIAQEKTREVPSTLTVPGSSQPIKVKFWDGPYALAAYDPSTENGGPGSGFTYIRFHDDSDPNHLTLRATPRWIPTKDSFEVQVLDVAQNPPTVTRILQPYGVHIAGTSKTAITNLAIQGAYVGIRISGGSNNIVKDCDIRHGRHRILMEGEQAPGSTNNNCHDNDISSNTFTLDMYGYERPGNYQVASPTSEQALKEWFYRFLKYVVGDTSTADVAIRIGVCGKNNCIHDNTFQNGGEGIFTYLSDNTQIYSNTFQHLSDCGVLASDFAQLDQPSLPSGETVQNNTFIDVTLCIRYDRIDVADGVTTNFHYFLCNKGHNCGTILEFHEEYDSLPPQPGSSPSPPSTVAKFALTAAGNKFEATVAALSLSAYTTARGGIPAVNIASNSFLSLQTLFFRGNPKDRKTFKFTCGMVGSFVSNRVVDDMKELPPAPPGSAPVEGLPLWPVWYGVTNTPRNM